MTTLKNLTSPAGTYGLAIEPWSKGEIYAVAANWAEASSPVLAYGENGWEPTGRQVADYSHRRSAALEEQLAEALRASGDDEDDAANLIGDAIQIGDGSDEEE